MSFMQQYVTDRLKWYQADTREGICSVPCGEFSLEQCADMWDVEIEEIETKKGYGARLSAPGYMDCTEWTVFDTEQEAKDYLEEMYGDD